MQQFHLTKSAVVQIAEAVLTSSGRLVWKIGKVENRHAGSWLGRSPFRKMEKCRYVFTSYFQGLRWLWLGSRTQSPLLNGIGLCNTQKTFIDWRVTMQKKNKEMAAVSRSFTSFQMVHTHTLPQEGVNLRSRPWSENEEEGWGREMKMRWRWQWDESYLTRTQRGERKRRGKEEKTPTHET